MNLLPEIFQGEEPLENEVIEAIEKQLKRINDKNRELNDKKIEKISRILEDVWNQISQQRELVRRINRFFHSGEKTITGKQPSEPGMYQLHPVSTRMAQQIPGQHRYSVRPF